MSRRSNGDKRCSLGRKMIDVVSLVKIQVVRRYEQ